MNPITYRTLDVTEIYPELFEHFERFQEVTHCWRKENGKWLLKETAFTEQWDEADYRSLCEKLKKTIERQGVVFSAFSEGNLCGFCSVENELFGPELQYLALSELYVSAPMRRFGIGKQLFTLTCDFAKGNGARKLYLSAHSSKESQAFYHALGCREAQWYHPALTAAEPCDCQLEKELF